MTTASDLIHATIEIRLSDLQQIRDRLMHLRDRDSQTRQLYSHVAALYQRHYEEVRSRHPQLIQTARKGPPPSNA